MKLSDWINDRVLSDENLKYSFQKGRPFKHIVIDNFLTEQRVKLLHDALLKEKFSFKDSDLFSFSQTNDLSDSRNEMLKSFAYFVSSKEFSDFVSGLTGFELEAGAIDLAGSLYQSGDYLLCHDDRVEDRKIAYIIYLSKDFKETDGAKLLLYDSVNGKPNKVVKGYTPKWNSIMIFEVSPESFHAVEENFSDKKRYAIGGWLH